MAEAAPVAPAWLTARPVAHRGLHDRAAGVIENTPAAVKAAIAGGFAIEVDVQLTADGEAVVHHDEVLGRVAAGAGRLDQLTASALKAVGFHVPSPDHAIITLGELVDLVAGRVPLIVELKSHFDGNPALPLRVAAVLSGRPEPVAVMSFDPVMVGVLARALPAAPRGIVAEAHYTHREWDFLTPDAKARLAAFADRPPVTFTAYHVNDLPFPPDRPGFAALARPLLTWTVRTPVQRDIASRHADQMIFEGFLP